MYATPLGVDGAELRPMEVWHVPEFFANIDGEREFLGRHVGLPDVVPDLDGSRAFLKWYADKRATDTGSPHGIWLDGTRGVRTDTEVWAVLAPEWRAARETAGHGGR